MDFSALSRGIAEAGTEDLTKRRDQALKLKLESKLIEMELEKQKELVDYGRFSPEASEFLAKQAGYESQPGEQFTVSQANLFGGLKKSENALLGRAAGRGSGLDRPISSSVAAAYKKTYGVDAPQGTTYRDIGALRGFGGRVQDIGEVSEGISGLSEIPRLKSQLAEIDTRTGGRIARSAANGNSLAALAYPEVAQAYRAAEKAYLQATGGKNITAGEKKIVSDMIMSWAYDENTQTRALESFRDLVANKLKSQVNSGKLGFAREAMIQDLNKALIENGVAPLELDMLGTGDSDAPEPRNKAENSSAAKADEQPNVHGHRSTMDLLQEASRQQESYRKSKQSGSR